MSATAGAEGDTRARVTCREDSSPRAAHSRSPRSRRGTEQLTCRCRGRWPPASSPDTAGWRSSSTGQTYLFLAPTRVSAHPGRRSWDQQHGREHVNRVVVEGHHLRDRRRRSSGFRRRRDRRRHVGRDGPPVPPHPGCGRLWSHRGRGGSPETASANGSSFAPCSARRSATGRSSAGPSAASVTVGSRSSRWLPLARPTPLAVTGAMRNSLRCRAPTPPRRTCSTGPRWGRSGCW